MAKTLIIAEKPSVARDIASALGKVGKEGDHFENEQYIVTSAVCHLVELYMPQDYDKKFGRWSLQNLPINPLCSSDCPGLCPDCGMKWIELPEDHEHAPADIRWAGLENWDGGKNGSGQAEK